MRMWAISAHLVIIDSVVESDTKWSLRNGDW